MPRWSAAGIGGPTAGRRRVRHDRPGPTRAYGGLCGRWRRPAGVPPGRPVRPGLDHRRLGDGGGMPRRPAPGIGSPGADASVRGPVRSAAPPRPAYRLGARLVLSLTTAASGRAVECRAGPHQDWLADGLAAVAFAATARGRRERTGASAVAGAAPAGVPPGRPARPGLEHRRLGEGGGMPRRHRRRTSSAGSRPRVPRLSPPGPGSAGEPGGGGVVFPGGVEGAAPRIGWPPSRSPRPPGPTRPYRGQCGRRRRPGRRTAWAPGSSCP
jgi:hypothetical protein